MGTTRKSRRLIPPSSRSRDAFVRECSGRAWMSGRSWFVHLSRRSSNSRSVGRVCSGGVARNDVYDLDERCAHSVHLRRTELVTHLLECREESSMRIIRSRRETATNSSLPLGAPSSLIPGTWRRTAGANSTARKGNGNGLSNTRSSSGVTRGPHILAWSAHGGPGQTP